MEPFGSTSSSRLKTVKDHRNDGFHVENQTWYQSPRLDQSGRRFQTAKYTRGWFRTVKNKMKNRDIRSGLCTETRTDQLAINESMLNRKGVGSIGNKQSGRIARQNRNKTERRSSVYGMKTGRKNRSTIGLPNIQKTQNFKRSIELANLLRNWDLGGEIKEKRNRKSICYRCKKTGHFAWDCPSKTKSDKHVRATLEDFDSYGQQLDQENSPLQPYHQSHVERIIINGDYLVEGTDNDTWNSMWYVNSKISKHMTPNQNLIIRFKGCFSINNEDQHQIPIHGVGEIELTTNERVFVVPYVSYAPHININVLSLKQLILQGFEVDIKDSKCVITHMCVEQDVQEDDQNESIYAEINQVSNENEKGTIEDELEIDGKKVPIIIETFDEFISFMVLVNCDRVCYKNKRLFERKFEEAVGWLHRIKIGRNLALPPKLEGLGICLFDFYKFVIK